MRCFRPDCGFSLVEALLSLLILCLVIAAFLGMLINFSKITRIEGALAEDNERIRFAVAGLLGKIRSAGCGGIPLVYSPSEGSFEPLALDIVDNAPGGCRFSSSITGKIFSWTSNRPVVPGTDVLRLRGVLSGPLWDVGEENLSSPVLSVPRISPWSGLPQDISSIPGGRAHALLVTGGIPLDIRVDRGAMLHGPSYRLVEICEDPVKESNHLKIIFDDSETQGYRNLNPLMESHIEGEGISRAGLVDDLVFFIGENNFGERSLYRIRVHTNNGTIQRAEEMVPGVFDLQLALGCDEDLDGRVDADQWYCSAGRSDSPGIGVFSTLREIRVSLVARSGVIDREYSSRIIIPENGIQPDAAERDRRYRILRQRINLRALQGRISVRDISDED